MQAVPEADAGPNAYLVQDVEEWMTGWPAQDRWDFNIIDEVVRQCDVRATRSGVVPKTANADGYDFHRKRADSVPQTQRVGVSHHVPQATSALAVGFTPINSHQLPCFKIVGKPNKITRPIPVDTCGFALLTWSRTSKSG